MFEPQQLLTLLGLQAGYSHAEGEKQDNDCLEASQAPPSQTRRPLKQQFHVSGEYSCQIQTIEGRSEPTEDPLSQSYKENRYTNCIPTEEDAVVPESIIQISEEDFATQAEKFYSYSYISQLPECGWNFGCRRGFESCAQPSVRHVRIAR